MTPAENDWYGATFHPARTRRLSGHAVSGENVEQAEDAFAVVEAEEGLS